MMKIRGQKDTNRDEREKNGSKEREMYSKKLSKGEKGGREEDRRVDRNQRNPSAPRSFSSHPSLSPSHSQSDTAKAKLWHHILLFALITHLQLPPAVSVSLYPNHFSLRVIFQGEAQRSGTIQRCCRSETTVI